jgi:hypothetical protein
MSFSIRGTSLLREECVTKFGASEIEREKGGGRGKGAGSLDVS